MLKPKFLTEKQLNEQLVQPNLYIPLELRMSKQLVGMWQTVKTKVTTKEALSKQFLYKRRSKIENKNCYHYFNWYYFPNIKIVLAKCMSDQWFILAWCFSHSHMRVGECLFPALLDLAFCTILVYLGYLIFYHGKVREF